MTTPKFQTTYNPARNNTFEFAIFGQKKLSLQCEGVPLTGIVLGDAIANAPYNLRVPDNQVDLDPVTVEFEVSEDYSEWWEITNWMYRCTHTNDAHIRESTTSVLNILDNNSNPIMVVTYIGVQPVSLGQMQYTTTDTGSTEIKNTFIFRYDTVKIDHIPSNSSIEFHDK